MKTKTNFFFFPKKQNKKTLREKLRRQKQKTPPNPLYMSVKKMCQRWKLIEYKERVLRVHPFEG